MTTTAYNSIMPNSYKRLESHKVSNCNIATYIYITTDDTSYSHIGILTNCS